MAPIAILVLLAGAALAQTKDASTFETQYVDPTLRQIESAAHGVAAPAPELGPAAQKAAAYVRRFVDPISEALESQATQAARALGSPDPNAAAPAEPRLELPDPMELLRATFLSRPEVRGVAPQASDPTAKPADFTYRPAAEKRADSLKLVRRTRAAARPRLKAD